MDAPPSIFDLDSVHEDPDAGERALSLCRGCPVRTPCLDYAWGNEPYGIWGGKDAVTRRRERGKPLADRAERAEASRLRARLRMGVTAGTIALEYGVSVRTVMRWKAAAGLIDHKVAPVEGHGAGPQGAGALRNIQARTVAGDVGAAAAPRAAESAQGTPGAAHPSPSRVDLAA